MIEEIRRVLFAGVGVLAVSAVAASVSAQEAIVKPKPTPAPTAGPTVAATKAFCGDPSGTATELFERYSKAPELSQVYNSEDYVAYSDSKDQASAMYTFTTDRHPAHPTAVCRKIVKEGENLVVKMHIVCGAAESNCNDLRNDFNVMTARMQADIDQKISAGKK